MRTHHTLQIAPNDAGQRLDKFIRKAVPAMPQSMMYKLIRTKDIRVNGRRAAPEQMLQPGDCVAFYAEASLFGEGGNGSCTSAPRSTAQELSQIKPALDIVFEDENIMILSKPAGMLSHSGDERPAAGGRCSAERGTLLGRIWAYLYARGEYSPDAEQSFAPALCNRLDRNTAGLVLAAKNAPALRAMNAVIKHRQLHKYYLCAVHGVPRPEAATLHAYLRRDRSEFEVSVSGAPAPGYVPIATRYRTLRAKNGLALLEIELLTGRTHQIRAHMAHIGHPLLGDGKYGEHGAYMADRAAGYSRQALLSYKIEFDFDEQFLSDAAPLGYLNGMSFQLPTEGLEFVRMFE